MYFAYASSILALQQCRTPYPFYLQNVTKCKEAEARSGLIGIGDGVGGATSIIHFLQKWKGGFDALEKLTF
jgi:hypothetical protein